MNAQLSNLYSDHISPPSLVEPSRRVMGSIDYDPCTSITANKYIVKAETFYTAKTNGFDKIWTGNVWINPPGGYCNLNGVCAPRDAEGKQIRKGYPESAPGLWWRKLAQLFALGHVNQFCYEAFSIEQLSTLQDVDSPYPGIHGIASNGQRYPFYWCILKDRPRHLLYLGDGKFEEEKSPTHNGAIVYGGPNGEAFKREFAHLGAIVRPSEEWCVNEAE